MTLDEAQKLKAKCTVALITSNWTKMTNGHLHPGGNGTQFLTANANDVVGLIAKAMKLGGAGGGPLTACNAYSAADDASKAIFVGTFTNPVGQTNPGLVACLNILVVVGMVKDELVFYSAYPVQALPAAGLLGPIV